MSDAQLATLADVMLDELDALLVTLDVAVTQLREARTSWAALQEVVSRHPRH